MPIPSLRRRRASWHRPQAHSYSYAADSFYHHACDFCAASGSSGEVLPSSKMVMQM